MLSVYWPAQEAMATGSLFADSIGVAHEDAVVEKDPSGRYERYNHCLGKGATKRVYKGFDQEQGIEVAWNQVELTNSQTDREATDRLFEEITLLKKLKHKRIMTFHDWWFDSKHRNLNFITEYFPSGTLRQYRKRFQKVITVSIIKRWGWQILEGLVYLHGHYPPIIHRDVKADNIFVNGATGQVKIGDLGLATAHRGLSVVGTPEFMAPEVYDEKYDEKVDIYSFGMCLLELATLEYPYAECRGVAQIYRKVSQGIPPTGMAKVTNSELREFIELCINFEPDARPSARCLLRHTFFEDVRPDRSPPLSISPVSPSNSSISPRSVTSNDKTSFYSLNSPTEQTVSVDLSRSMHSKFAFGDTPSMLECGTSSDDEVLISTAVLRNQAPPNYVRSMSDSDMGRPLEMIFVEGEQGRLFTPVRSVPQHVVVRRKLLEQSTLSGLRVNSM